MSEPVVFQKAPMRIEEEPGVKAWCACGLTKNQPYCDGSHRGTGFAPVRVEIAEKKTVAWCACRHSEAKPFCDGAHKKLP